MDPISKPKLKIGRLDLDESQYQHQEQEMEEDSNVIEKIWLWTIRRGMPLAVRLVSFRFINHLDPNVNK